VRSLILEGTFGTPMSDTQSSFFRDLVDPSGQFLLGLWCPHLAVVLAIEWFRFRYWTAIDDPNLSLDWIRRGTDLAVGASLFERPLQVFDVLKGELFVAVGLGCLLWYGLSTLSSARKKGLLFVGAQACAAVYVLLAVTSANLFRHSGILYDLTLAKFFLSSPKLVLLAVMGESGGALVTYMIAAGVLLLAPWLLGRLWARWSWLRERSFDLVDRRIVWLGLGLVGLGGLLPGLTDVPPSIARNTVRLTLEWRDDPEALSKASDELPAFPIWADLEWSDTREDGASKRSGEASDPPPNVVVVFAESVRPEDMSLYRPDGPETTPFLEELGARSAVFERAYTPITETWKAVYAGLCGVRPEFAVTTGELSNGVVPATCLPAMLREEGYATAFFKASHLLTRADVFGFERQFTSDDVDETAYSRSNYLGYEDRAMLGPTRRWLQQHPDRPLMATYVTVTTHTPYTVERGDRGLLGRSPESVRRGYLETLRYFDGFVEDLVELLEKEGRYDNTILVVIGDHGEGFGEHGLYNHAGGGYEELIRVPFLIHDAREPSMQRRIDGPVSHLDLVPTLVERMGAEVVGADYEGVDALAPLPDRTLFTHGWFEGRAVTAIRGSHKYIHHLDVRRDRFYDLAADPREQHPVALDAERRRRWRRRISRAMRLNHARYERYRRGDFRQRVFEPGRMPEFDVALDAELEPGLVLEGVDLPEDLRPGRRRRFALFFRVESEQTSPPGALRFRLGTSNGIDETMNVPVWSHPDRVVSGGERVMGRAVELEMPDLPEGSEQIRIELEYRRADGWTRIATWSDLPTRSDAP
jgi:arylsulfatase A-like enzyme